MSSTPWFKFYPGDYLSDTRRLTRSQHGAFLLIIIDYFSSGSPPPNDDLILARLTLCDTQSEWLAIRKAIEKYFIVSDVWINTRCEKEIAARRSEHDKKSAAGKKGNEIKQALTQSDTVSDTQSDTLKERNVRSQKLDVRSKTLEVIDQKSEPEKSKSKDLRSSRLAKDWFLPKSWGEWAIKERAELTPERLRNIADQFKDHWIAQPSQKGVKNDWYATWRNWVRREKGMNGSKASVADQNKSAIEEWKAGQGDIYEQV